MTAADHRPSDEPMACRGRLTFRDLRGVVGSSWDTFGDRAVSRMSPDGITRSAPADGHHLDGIDNALELNGPLLAEVEAPA